MSALWILVANGWMQNPVGAAFNFETMRMELVDFGALIFNPVAQVKFVHTVSAGYVTGAIFVLAISSYYLLKNVIFLSPAVHLQLPQFSDSLLHFQ